MSDKILIRYASQALDEWGGVPQMAKSFKCPPDALMHAFIMGFTYGIAFKQEARKKKLNPTRHLKAQIIKGNLKKDLIYPPAKIPTQPPK